LNSVGKLFEGLVSRQLYSFVEENDLISQQQYGFRRQRSTVDQLVSMLSHINRGRDGELDCDCIFLDLSKAFDRASHVAIINSTTRWCSDSAREWLESFITERSIRVRVGSSYSDVQSLGAGVPQGSHLGPLLFNLMVNSLTSVTTNPLSLFADDCNLLCVSAANTTLRDHNERILSLIHPNQYTYTSSIIHVPRIHASIHILSL